MGLAGISRRVPDQEDYESEERREHEETQRLRQVELEEVTQHFSRIRSGGSSTRSGDRRHRVR